MTTPDWTQLWQLAAAGFVLDPDSYHGPAHWRAVERNAIELAKASSADVIVVRLFAILHDAKRQTEGTDPEHGPRAARWAAELRGTHFDLDDGAFAILVAALEDHDRGRTSDDPTIGTCWDADRLELTRVGIKLDPRLFSTAEGKRRAREAR